MDGDEEQDRPVVGGNVTFDPLAAALRVEEPAIREVLANLSMRGHGSVGSAMRS